MVEILINLLVKRVSLEAQLPKEKYMALFGKNATLLQKIFGSFLLIVIVLCFIAMFTEILVDNSVIIFIFWLACSFSVVIIVFVLKSLSNQDSQIRKNVDAQGQSIILTAVAVIIGVPVLTVFAFSKGVPAVLHMATSQRGEMIVTVSKKPYSYSSKRCQGSVYLKNYTYFMNDKVSGLKQDHWLSIKPGDQIRLTGEKSMFGFSTEKYRILK